MRSQWTGRGLGQAGAGASLGGIRTVPRSMRCLPSGLTAVAGPANRRGLGQGPRKVPLTRTHSSAAVRARTCGGPCAVLPTPSECTDHSQRRSGQGGGVATWHSSGPMVILPWTVDRATRSRSHPCARCSEQLRLGHFVEFLGPAMIGSREGFPPRRVCLTFVIARQIEDLWRTARHRYVEAQGAPGLAPGHARNHEVSRSN
jgi:hypothetical protein